jgi:hypothetical protein
MKFALVEVYASADWKYRPTQSVSIEMVGTKKECEEERDRRFDKSVRMSLADLIEGEEREELDIDNLPLKDVISRLRKFDEFKWENGNSVIFGGGASGEPSHTGWHIVEIKNEE